MLEQFKGFFGGQKPTEQQKEKLDSKREGIKNKYAAIFKSTALFFLLSYASSDSKAQDSADAQFKNKRDNEPTLTVGDGALIGPDIRPLGIQQGGGIMQIELRDDYQIKVYQNGKFLRSDLYTKGIQSIPYGEGITHTVIDKNGNVIWDASLFTEKDIKTFNVEPRVSLEELREEKNIQVISDANSDPSQHSSEATER